MNEKGVAHKQPFIGQGKASRIQRDEHDSGQKGEEEGEVSSLNACTFS
jgi:hypothetical protein